MRTIVESRRPGQPIVLVHGGAGSRPSQADGCLRAARTGLASLGADGDALDAVVQAVTAMEGDGRFNAGCGSALRMDGETIECDAGLMDTRGRLGAVAALRDTPSPILVARAVAATPHWLLAGEGARAFASTLNLVHPFPPSAHAKRMHRLRLRRMLEASPGTRARGAFKRYWNFPLPWRDAMDRFGSGTVGALGLDKRGQFAVATSTGGAMPALFGRVGDTPIIGCGFFAGPAGAVAATGIGEHIVRNLLSVTVYRWLESGLPLGAAIDKGLALIPESVNIGLIAITRTQAAVAARNTMATAMLRGRATR
jgi:beta-aspartyl-peptidase (threonine type)